MLKLRATLACDKAVAEAESYARLIREIRLESGGEQRTEGDKSRGSERECEETDEREREGER